MSVFQSFQTGLALGQEQRKQRDMDTARKGAAEAYKLGNFEGATSGLMAAGLYDEADAYGRAGERVKAEKKRETYGEAFKTGGWTALGEMAGAEGDFETAGLAQQQARAKTLQDWEDRDRKITEQKQGVEFLATSASQIRSLPLEARGQAALDAISRSPFAQDQAVIQAVEQAAADGRITDEELTAFEEQMLTYAQRLEGERWQKSFDAGRADQTQSQSNWERQFAADEAARKATASSAGRYGVTPVFGRDANGNRVILQTNNAGGVDMANLPEGITLEDDYSRTYSRETAKNDAKIAAYETTAGRALSAFETKADELMGQIDTAIEQTDGWNTGVLGQFIAAGDLDGTLDAIGAKAMLSELVAIKDQGGTLGALSDSEGKALRDAAVNVARSQSEKQLDANLRAYRLQVERAKMVLKQAFEEQYVNGAQAPRGGAPAATGARVGPSGQPPPPGFE